MVQQIQTVRVLTEESFWERTSTVPGGSDGMGTNPLLFGFAAKVSPAPGPPQQPPQVLVTMDGRQAVVYMKYLRRHGWVLEPESADAQAAYTTMEHALGHAAEREEQSVEVDLLPE